MSIRTFATVAGTIALIGSLPIAAQAQIQTTPTTKHRMVGSYYWQQATPPETKPEPAPVPTAKHRVVGSYYWQLFTTPETQPALTPKHRLVDAHAFVPQSKPQETKPEPKPEAKPATAATLAGKWSVNIETGNGPMQSGIDIKADPKDAKKVTGTVNSQMGEAAFEGELVDGKLTFWFKMNANGSDISVTFTGTLQKDGSLAGTLNYGQGEVPWTATKEKK